LLDFDLEDSDDDPDSIAVVNSPYDEDVDAGDPETTRDDETEIDSKDGKASDDEVTEDETTDDEGMGQYWKLKLEEGLTRRVAVIDSDVVPC